MEATRRVWLVYGLVAPGAVSLAGSTLYHQWETAKMLLTFATRTSFRAIYDTRLSCYITTQRNETQKRDQCSFCLFVWSGWAISPVSKGLDSPECANGTGERVVTGDGCSDAGCKDEYDAGVVGESAGSP